MFGHTTQRTQPQFMAMRIIPPPKNQTITPPITPPPEQTEKMKWGAPTWFFLHTIAHKVKPETFTEIRAELLRIIYTICTNLPCPDCSQHAKQYLNNINFNTINTREDLQNMLFVFHNSLNQRKRFAIFTREQLEEKYSAANTGNIFNHFITIYADKSKSIRMIADEMYRARIVEQVRVWVLTHTQYFYG